MRLLLLLLFAAPAFGVDPPKLKEHSPVPKKETNLSDLIPVEQGKYRFFGVTTEDGKPYTGPVTWVTDGTSVGIKEVGKAMTIFGVISGFTEPGEYDVPAGDVIVWGKAEGVTTVQAWGVVDSKAKMLLTLKFLVGPAPPSPTPTPRPTPAPVTGKLFAVAVMDRLTADPAQAQALGSSVFRDYLAAGGHSFEIVDTSTAAGKAKAANFEPFAAAAKVTAPYYLIMDADGPQKGLVRSVVSLPKSDAELVSVIKTLTGK